MDKFLPAGRVKNNLPVRTYSVAGCGHCPMDILIEELCGFPDVNVLVVGVGECVYYSMKQPFCSGCRCWGFDLTDKELVFGSTQALEQALLEIADNGKMTVCIMTCIPAIMDLAIEDIVDGHENMALVKAPDYTQAAPGDILSELYEQIGKNLRLHEGPAQVWDQAASVRELQEKLTRSLHIVNNRKFLELVQSFEADGVSVIDNTVFHSLDFYEENCETLGIDRKKIEQLRKIVSRFAQSGCTFGIKSRHAAALANFLNGENVPVGYIVTDGADKYKLAACARAEKSMQVSFDYSAELPAGNNLVLNTEGQYENFDTLYELMKEADGQWV